MTLCLAKSLIKDGFDEISQLELYLKWYKNAYMSGKVKDIGETILNALLKYESDKTTLSTNKNPYSAGNGSLMRIAPIALYNYKNIKEALRQSALSSYTTHGLDICADACKMYAGLIVLALQGLSKDEILSHKTADFLISLDKKRDIDEKIKLILNGSYKEKQRDEISSSGYVVHSLEAALWCFYNSSTFKDGLIMAVNLGGDTDTIGAIYGQLAGAYYGYDEIPKYLRKNLLRRKFIKKMALKLLDEVTR